VISNKNEAIDKAIEYDKEMRISKQHGSNAKELQAEIIEYIGDREEVDLGAVVLKYPFIDTVGVINEDLLRADYPETYNAYARTSIDVRALRDGDPHIYNAVLISSPAQRRFSYKIDAARLENRTGKKVRKGVL
jgi:hypothetical protein